MPSPTNAKKNHDLGYEFLKRFAYIIDQTTASDPSAVIGCLCPPRLKWIRCAHRRIAWSRCRRETKDTFTLRLSPAEGCSGPLLMRPGQFSMIYALWRRRSTDLDQRRPAAGKPAGIHGAIGRPGDSIAGQAERPGDWLGVRGPFGCGLAVGRGPRKERVDRRRWDWPGAAAVGYLPRLASHRKDYSRLMVLYGARSPRDLLYRKELSMWARYPDTAVAHHRGLWRRRLARNCRCCHEPIPQSAARIRTALWR